MSAFSFVSSIIRRESRLRSQDFAIFHIEYIRFESLDRLRMLSSGFYTRIGPVSLRKFLVGQEFDGQKA